MAEMDDSMKGEVVLTMSGCTVAAERGLWMQQWPLSGRVVDAEVVVGAKVVRGYRRWMQ